MRNMVTSYKKFIQVICILILMIGMGFALISKNAHYAGRYIISTDSKTGMLWLSNTDILNILHLDSYSGTVVNPADKLNPDQIERTLEQNPFIEKATVFIDANNDVHISIKPTVAIARVINMKGVSYYLSNSGQMLPLSVNFTPRVLVATGAITNNGPGDNENDTALLHTLFFVAKKIKADTFLSALTEQLVIDYQNEWTLIPKWGRARILLGDTQAWDDKIIRLKAFYVNKDKDVQWSHYNLINLKYAGQVVCTRDDIVPKAIKIDNAPNHDTTGIVKRQKETIIVGDAKRKTTSNQRLSGSADKVKNNKHSNNTKHKN